MKMVKRYFLHSQLIALLFSSSLLGGITLVSEYAVEDPFKSVEISIREHSPRGMLGGSIIPASCPSDLHDDPTYGQTCIGTNECGSAPSTYQCGGVCTPPPLSTTAAAGYGDSCTAPPNACGKTASAHSISLTWRPTNSTSCVASADPSHPEWSGQKDPSPGPHSQGIAFAPGTYTITCSGAGGSVSASVTVSGVEGTI